MIDAVIFDMDGLLIDSEIITYKLYKKIFAKYGKYLDKAYYYGLLGTNADFVKKSFANYLGNTKLGEDIIYEVHKELVHYFDMNDVPIKKGARELIDYLSQKGIKMALATSSSRNRAIPIIEKGGLLDFFDAVVCGDEVKQSKPHPEIFLKAAKSLGIDPSYALVIEDSENGIIGAHTAGMKCINVPDLKKPSKNILEKADYIAEDLLEVIEYINQMNVDSELYNIN